MRNSWLTVAGVTVALLGAGSAQGGVPAESATYAYGGTRKCPADQRRGFNAKTLKGKRLIVAREIARRYGCSIRVVRRNGKNLPVTADLKPDRVNVAIKGPTRRVVKVFPTG